MTVKYHHKYFSKARLLDSRDFKKANIKEALGFVMFGLFFFVSGIGATREGVDDAEVAVITGGLLVVAGIFYGISRRFRKLFSGGSAFDIFVIESRNLIAIWKISDPTLENSLRMDKPLIWGKTYGIYMIALVPIVDGLRVEYDCTPKRYKLAHYCRFRSKIPVSGYGRLRWIPLDFEVVGDLDEVEKQVRSFVKEIDEGMLAVSDQYSAATFPDPMTLEPLKRLRCTGGPKEGEETEKRDGKGDSPALLRPSSPKQPSGCERRL